MRRFALLLLVPLMGCLSIVRVPVVRHADYSDDGCCTNRVWFTPLRAMQERNDDIQGLYPSIKMRWKCTKQVYWTDEDEGKLTGEEIYHRKCAKRFGWLPLILLWLSSPLDAAVDTIAIPWDW